MKLNMPIIFLGMIIIGIIYTTYYAHDSRVKERQLQQLTNNIINSIVISSQTNFSFVALKKTINVLAAKNNVHRLIVLEKASKLIVADNKNENIGKHIDEGLINLDGFTYKNLNQQTNKTSYNHETSFFYHLKEVQLVHPEQNRIRPYQIFVSLVGAETHVSSDNSLAVITTIFTLGILLLLVTLYAFQRRFLIKPLEAIITHLGHQTESEVISTIPLASKDELGQLVSQYNLLVEHKLLQEEKLAESRMQIYGITNTAPVLLSYVGQDLKFRFVNQIHEDWFGMTIEVFVDNSLEDILGAQSFESIKPEIDKVLAGQRCSFESTIPYQYTEDKAVHINLVPNKKPDNSVDGFFVCIEDLNEAKRNEIKLAEYAQRLEFREFELEDEKILAEQALKIKSEFLASMSHEIRTPMNGVLGMLHLLLETNLNDDQITKAQLAKTSAESLLNIINDVLDFSKFESGNLEIEQIDFNLTELIENTTEGLSKLAEDKSLSLIIDTSDIEKTFFKGDPGRIRQILNNLLSNAIKFTHQGSVIIEARVIEEFTGQWNFICEVRDTGIGIEQSKLDSIFDSFTQVDASTTRQYGGTGLGLAIAKKLCHIMEGDIHALSTPNEGSQFTFNIMLAPSHKQSDLRYDFHLENTQCIILDSDLENTKNLSKQLTKWGALSSICSSPKSVTEQLQTHDNTRPIIIFVNSELPGQTGLEFIQQTYALFPHKDLKFVLMSSLSLNRANRDLDELHHTEFFYRPVTKTKLLNTIKTLQQRQSELAAPTKSDETEGILPTDKRILLVEDTPVNQLVVKGILSTFQVDCDVAGNGIIALDKLQDSDKYDLILMDCQMPEMNGYETTQAIREGQAGERYQTIPIIAMTANAMKGDEETCLEAGMNDYMSKPISADIIKEKLSKWLSK